MIDDYIKKASEQSGLDPDLLRRVMKQESGFNPKAYNKGSGATGLMQLTDIAVKDLAQRGIHVNKDDPEQNAIGGAMHLKKMVDRFGTTLGVAAYNWGEGNVSKALAANNLGHVPSETLNYVKNIIGVDLKETQATLIPRQYSLGDIKKNQEETERLREEAQRVTGEPSGWEDTFLAMKEQGIVHKTLESLDIQLEGDDPNWNPSYDDYLKQMEAKGVPQAYLPAALEATSDKHLDLILNRIRTELDDREVIHRAGVMTQLSAGIVDALSDPVNVATMLATSGLAPFLGAGRMAYTVGQGAINAAGSAAEEAVLYGLSETKPADDILIAAGSGFLLGGALSNLGYTQARVNQRLGKLMVSLKDDHKLLEAADQALKAGDTQGAMKLLEHVSPENRSKLTIEGSDAGAAQVQGTQIEQGLDPDYFNVTKVKDEIQDHIDRIEDGTYFDLLTEKVHWGGVGKSLDEKIAMLNKSASGYLENMPVASYRLLARLGENGVGVDRFGKSTGKDAEIEAAMLQARTQSAWLETTNDAFLEYDKAMGNNWWKRDIRRAEFMKAVADYYESGVDTSLLHPSIGKVVGATKRFFEAFRKELVDSGLMEDMPLDTNYLPHILNYPEIRRIAKSHTPEDIQRLLRESLESKAIKENKFTPDERMQAKLKELETAVDTFQKQKEALDQQLADLLKQPDPKNVRVLKGKVAKARQQVDEARKAFRKYSKFLKDYPEYYKKILDRLAKGYTRNMLTRGVGLEGTVFHGISLDDATTLRHMLKEGGMEDEAIEDVIANISVHDPKDGGFSRVKSRVDFDMTHAIEIKKPGSDKPLRLSMTDLFHRDLDFLTASYAREVSGRVGVAKVTGIKNASQFENLLKKAREEALTQGISPAKVNKAEASAKYLWKGVLGIPMDSDPGQAAVRVGRWLRDLNFIRVGSGFVYAQLSELGGVLGHIGLTAMVKQVPALGELKQMLKPQGRLPEGFLRQLQAMAGVGTNYLRNAVYTGIHDGEEAMAGTVDRILHKSKNFIGNASGFNTVMRVEQFVAAAGYAQNLVDLSRKLKGDISKLKPNQIRELQSLGLEDEQAIKNLMESLADPKKVKFRRNHAIHEFIEDQWDPKTFNDLSFAIAKMTRRLVQENSYGTTFSIPLTHTWPNSNWFLKLLFQFKSFAISAIAKQTLQGLSQRDMTIASRFAMGLFFGGMTYMAQQWITNRDSPTYEANMSWEKIATGAINRTGLVSILPTLIDSAVTLGSGGSVAPVFAHGRTSGLKMAPPAMDTLSQASQLVLGSANAALRNDYEFSQTEARALKRLIPLALVPGATRAVDTWISGLPKRSYAHKQDLLENFFAN
jgi:tetratricopeptide (TPR) repeat protein